ncbi:MAG: phosphoadenosine phosphosulfate reductase family protein [Bacillaceae bacterium]|nr:phosphoadenosine phosphosulfate reductase family protein [Bacillaceae bacterium]
MSNLQSKRDDELMETLRIMEEMNNGVFEQKFEAIIDHMKEVYLGSRQDFALMYSSGKDSALVLHLFMTMLSRLDPCERTKKVHVISADTKVETKVMTDFLMKNLELIKKHSKELNLQVHLVQPDLKHSFGFNVIAKGYPYPMAKSPFQWCTSKHKLFPMNRKINELLEQIGVPSGKCGFTTLSPFSRLFPQF